MSDPPYAGSYNTRYARRFCHAYEGPLPKNQKNWLTGQCGTEKAFSRIQTAAGFRKRGLRALTGISEVLKKNYCDFIGTHHYTRSVVSKVGDNLTREGAPKSDFGWEIYAAGLTEVCPGSTGHYSRYPLSGLRKMESATVRMPSAVSSCMEQFREIADAHLPLNAITIGLFWTTLNGWTANPGASARPC